MKSNTITTLDTLGLGFMTFAFFLGAGNLIFPTFAGMMAGQNITLAMIGFLVTAVGLPLAGLIAVAKAKGQIMRFLPTYVGVILSVIVYIIIGPAFAAPRTSLVAYEIGILPFISEAAQTQTFSAFGITLNQTQLISTSIFFIIALALSLNPGKLLETVGKVLTPLLILLLVVLATTVFFLPPTPIGEATGAYIANPLTKGIVDGYNTMDTLASIMFGALVIDILREKGVTEVGYQTKYLVRASFIAAAGLAFVYVSLFYLGVTMRDAAALAGADSGGKVLAIFVDNQYGFWGKVMLSIVVGLACLTTAIGLITACSDFFNQLVPKISYRTFAIGIAIICALVANVGLAELITISIPVLVSVYPVIITLVIVTYLTPYFTNPRFAQITTLAVAFFFGIFDGLKIFAGEITEQSTSLQVLAAKIANIFDFMPLSSDGLAWFLPTLTIIFTFVIVNFLSRKSITQTA